MGSIGEWVWCGVSMEIIQVGVGVNIVDEQLLDKIT